MLTEVGAVSGAGRLNPLSAVPVVGDPVTAYRSAQILGASPMQLILIVYDVALAACGGHDRARARRAVTELIAALNFDYEEIAVPLFRLYEYCLSAIDSGSYHEAAKILRQLKEAWETALRRAPAVQGQKYDMGV